MSRLQINHLLGRGVDAAELRVEDGACVALHGPSGSGKTLLLRAIADLDEAEGEVWLDATERGSLSGPIWRSRVGYLAAESHWWHRQVRPHAVSWNNAHLAALGFAPEALDWEIRRLSSGERQRLALARLLAHAPSALLLDEPTANLDQTNTARVERLVADWRADTGGCVVWVSHDADQRARIATTQFRLEHGVLAPDDRDG